MQKPIRKIISLIISSLAVLILSGFLSLRPLSEPPVKAHHEPSHACQDITLSSGTLSSGKNLTDPVYSPSASGRQAGVADSGQLDFNQPSLSYQACSENSTQALAPFYPAAAVTSGNFMEGWAWNTNLGYVSFYCKDGTNSGGSCGNVNYGVVGFRENASIRGFAWGDNTGWISMGCDDGSNVGVNCGSVNYGVKAATPAEAGQTLAGCGPLAVGDLYGYAWTDTVGWMNFCGAHVELTPPLVPSVNVTPSVISGGEPVYANGVDSYKIVIQILENGTPLASLESHTAVVEEINWTNTLRADQITLCGGPNPTQCNYNGAILPTPAQFAWNDIEKGLTAYVKTIAPANFPANSADKIILESLLINIDGMRFPATLNRSFEFLPAVGIKISAIDSETGNVASSISTVRNASEPIYLTAEKNAPVGSLLPIDDTNINIFTQLHDCSVNDHDFYDFIFDEDDAGGVIDTTTGELLELPYTGDPNDLPNIDVPSTACSTEPGATLTDINIKNLNDFFLNNQAKPITLLIYTYQHPGSPVISSATTENAVGVRTRVEYLANNKPVRYFSEIIPDGSVLNQAANITGNVRIDVQKMIKEKAVAQSLTNNIKESQEKREKFYRAIKKSINKKMFARVPNANGVFTIDPTTVSSTALKGIQYFNRDRLYNPEDMDKPCKIVFNNETADVNFPQSITVVSEGCDIFIDQNIYNSPGRLGIIALADWSMQGERKGGNVYICNRVTDIEANIVADGSIFPYGQTSNLCGDKDDNAIINQTNGIPKNLAREALKNQLTIFGSTLTNNTLGGSFMSPPMLGDGSLVTNPSDVGKARLYDFNFLRYANIKTDALGTTCWASGIALSKRFYRPGDNCPSNNPDSKGIVNIDYRSPTKDMPVFNAVK